MIILPWGLIALFLAYYMFYIVNKKRNLLRDERREKLKKSRQKFIDTNRK